MTPRFSLYLDMVRFCAALLVLLSHWAYPRFTGGDFIVIRELNLGSDAVVLFFVLSGLVIAYARDEKDRTLGDYVVNRATRIYSVALPALLFTYLADRAGAALNPAAYDGWWYSAMGPGAFLAYGASFANEWGLNGVRLGTNGPYWSLSYEVAYYCLFAAAVYMTGVRRALVLLALCVVIGFKALLLAPIWLMGVGVWTLARRGDLGLSRPLAGCLAVAPPIAYAALLAIGAPQGLMALTEGLTGLDAASINAILRFSDEALWNTLIGVLAALHFVGIAALCAKSGRVGLSGRAARAVRWLAGCSFSIYLVHYPALQFVDAVLPGTETMPLRAFVLLGTVVAVCLVFAWAFERRLKPIRRAARLFLHRLSGVMRHRAAGGV